MQDIQINEIKTSDFFGHKPRDPNRIEPMLAKLAELWKKAPDLRLGQFLLNSVPKEIQLYFIEDEDLLSKLETMYREADKE